MMQESAKAARIASNSAKSFVLLFCCLSLVSCGGDNDGMPVAIDTLRCTKPGLCLYETGKKSLQGAYREGDEELKFDVLYRPFHGLSVGEVYPWCMRMVDQKYQQFYVHNNDHCPPSWNKKDGLQRVGGAESYTSAFRRDDLAREMRKALSKQQVSKDRGMAFKEGAGKPLMLRTASQENHRPSAKTSLAKNPLSDAEQLLDAFKQTDVSEQEEDVSDEDEWPLS